LDGLALLVDPLVDLFEEDSGVLAFLFPVPGRTRKPNNTFQRHKKTDGQEAEEHERAKRASGWVVGGRRASLSRRTVLDSLTTSARPI